MKPLDKEVKKIRLQVFLSRNGVCSRREAMDVVKSGRVTVCERTIMEPSTLVDLNHQGIKVDGRLIGQKKYTYLLLNKPVGYITTKTNRHNERTILDLIPKKHYHLSPAGRLDKNTEGLLLLTNDGALLFRLTHPKFNIDKTYFVRVEGMLTGAHKKRLEQGVVIEGKKTAKAKVANVKTRKMSSQFELTIHEGRKRQVRLMCAKLKRKVIYLKRLSQGPLRLGSLNSGKWRMLKKEEVKRLRKLK